MEVRTTSYPRSTAPTYPPRSDGEAISDTTPYPIAIVAYIQISNDSRPMKLGNRKRYAPAPPALCNVLKINNAAQLRCNAKSP